MTRVVPSKGLVISNFGRYSCRIDFANFGSGEATSCIEPDGAVVHRCPLVVALARPRGPVIVRSPIISLHLLAIHSLLLGEVVLVVFLVAVGVGPDLLVFPVELVAIVLGVGVIGVSLLN